MTTPVPTADHPVPAVPTRSAASWRLDVGFVTHPGLVRERNEDAYTLFVPYEGEEHLSAIDGVFAVADGMGGHDAGDVASRHVVDAVIDAFAPGRAPAAPGVALPDLMEQLVTQLHRELHDMASRQNAERGMGSTLTLALVVGPSLFITHVGDSRCYRFRGGALERLTDDHSWVGEQVRAGLLSPEEAENHSKRNVLTQCLGIGAPPRIRVAEESLQDGDRFLLCSDGLHGLVPDEVIARVLAEETSQRSAQRLASLANERGGPDNITVVVFEVRRARLLSRTLPDGMVLVVDGAGGVMATSRRRTLAHALLAAGIVLLAAAGGAWFWLRPPPSAASATRPASPAAAADSAAGRLPPAKADTTSRPPARDTGAPPARAGAPPVTPPPNDQAAAPSAATSGRPPLTLQLHPSPSPANHEE